MSLADALLYELYRENLIENRGQINFGNNRYAILDRGWHRAQQAQAISGYVGPAPVTLEEYNDMVRRQSAARDAVTPRTVLQAMSGLVLSRHALQILGLVASSRRSLFMTGPAGNGKTTIASALHRAQPGDIWIPYAIEVDGHIIKVFDNHNHEALEPIMTRDGYDERWVRVKRPLVIVGGEMTIETMDLIYSTSAKYYEAPFQLKSNGGTLVIDDFGRQRVDPIDMLNRWITPLEGKTDYLTLHTGKKIAVPFEQMLVFATNMKPSDLVDDAFLRRMGYRLRIDPPDRRTYSDIFRHYAQKVGIEVPTEMLEYVFSLYEQDQRELRGCEPRDLLERCVDLCQYEQRPKTLTNDLLLMAWRSYFGQEQA